MGSEKVCVLMGGVSNEREISLASGANVAGGLREAGFEVEEVDLREKVLPQECLGRSDVVFIALHGEFGEDGALQELLEKEGIAYTGSSSRASRLAMNKLRSKEKFLSSHIPTAPHEVLSEKPSRKEVSRLASTLGFPVVLKPVVEGSSIGVHIAGSLSELIEWLTKEASPGRVFFLEKYIPGREITVGILDEQPLPIIEILPAEGFYDFTAKYGGASRYVPNPEVGDAVEREAKRIALAAHKVLGCRDFSRVDMRLSTEGVPYVLEVNTIPGFTRGSLLPRAASAAGISFSVLCAKIVQLALERSNKASGLVASHFPRNPDLE